MSSRPRRRMRARTYVRRYSARRYLRRRASTARIPLEVAVAAGAWAMTPVAEGWGSPIGYLQTGNMQEIGRMLNLSVLGANGNGQINIAGLLNPVAPEGKLWKMLILASIIHKVRTKLVKIPLKRVPFVGRILS